MNDDLIFNEEQSGVFFSDCGRYIIEKSKSGRWTAHTSKGHEQDADTLWTAVKLCQQHADGDHRLFNA